MTWRDRDAEKDRAVRHQHAERSRSWALVARRLADYHAPMILVQHAKEQAHAERLRSWGWVGPVPRMSE